MESETMLFSKPYGFTWKSRKCSGGQGGSALGGSDKLLEPPPFAPPSLVRRDYLRAQHQDKLELQDNVRITAVVLIDTHLTD